MTKDKSMRRTACAPACKPAGNGLGGRVRLSLKKYWFIYLLILPESCPRSSIPMAP